MKFIKKYGMALERIKGTHLVEVQSQGNYYVVQYDSTLPQPGDGVWFIEAHAGNGEVDHIITGVDL